MPFPAQEAIRTHADPSSAGVTPMLSLIDGALEDDTAKRIAKFSQSALAEIRHFKLIATSRDEYMNDRFVGCAWLDLADATRPVKRITCFHWSCLRMLPRNEREEQNIAIKVDINALVVAAFRPQGELEITSARICQLAVDLRDMELGLAKEFGE